MHAFIITVPGCVLRVCTKLDTNQALSTTGVRGEAGRLYRVGKKFGEDSPPKVCFGLGTSACDCDFNVDNITRDKKVSVVRYGRAKAMTTHE